MRAKVDRLEKIKKNILGKKASSFEEILNLFNCASITLRRDLRVLGAVTSYTHNGRFVTLSDIPHFDDKGLWFHHQVGFSRFGNSLETIIGLIGESKSGFTREEIEAIMKIEISKQIQILLQREMIHRIKFGNKYLYLPDEVMRNRKRKLALIGTRQSEEFFDKDVQLKDLIVLLKAVLVENEVGLDSKSIMQIGKKYSLALPVKKIEKLLLKYNLPEKKTRSP